MKKLWQKDYAQDKFVEAYCFEDTIALDNNLISQDALGSIAHAKMLEAMGILSTTEFIQLKQGLLEVIELANKGKFVVQSGDEDVHTKIENHLIAKLGEVGKKLHTGRSRNDQVLVDLRLYTKDSLFALADQCLALVHGFIQFAIKYELVLMPGYTHMQKAMPSSIGMWAGSFAESLLDDLEILKCSLKINDQSPLGSGAAYGVSLPIDRELTTKLLGFEKVQNNSLYAQVSRGKSHFIVLHALSQIMLTLSRFAEDLLLFTTSEFNFFSVDESFCTGSSIMPQKKNFDAMEYLRGRAHKVLGSEHTVASVISGLPSGYNADFGETKSPFFESIGIVGNTLKLCSPALQAITPNVEVLQSACTKEVFATHTAFLLVKQGMPFREAYKTIGLSLETLPTYDPKEIIEASSHTGGLGNLQLKKVKKEAELVATWWKKEQKKYSNIVKQLEEL